MTLRLMLTCDGAWDDGRFPCRAFVTYEPGHLAEAWLHAGWYRPRPGEHYCPAHARRLRGDTPHT